MTLYTYDETGNKLRQTDALGRTTSWSYDALGRVLSRTLPLGQSESFSYDANGNRLSQTDFKGQTIQFAYNQNDQLISKTLPSGQVSYTYSATGQPETLTDARGTTRYAYDQRGQLLQLTQPNGLTLAYAYDAVGNRTAVTTPSGTTQFVYDDLNRLEQVIDPQGGITWYEYDILGRKTRVVYPNATQANYVYDALHRLIQLDNRGPSQEVLSSHQFILGPTGNRLQAIESGGRVVAYQYDPLYRLTQEVVTDAVAGNSSLDFSYDAVGNRLTQVLNGVTTAYTYDDNDRLLTEGAISYTYDANGNTLSKAGPEGVVTSVYDAENRLVSVSVGGSTLAYTYDDSGIKVQATVDGITTDYLVDANRDYAQVLEELDSAGQATVQYRYGDDLISQVRDGQPSYYHYDGLGSTRALSDQAGLLANTYQYRPFGELAHSSGTIANNYLFAGEQFEPKTGLYYLRARWMGPGNGRFTGMDSWEGARLQPVTLNKYLYANVNPVSNIDPSGKNSLQELLVVISLPLAGAAIYSAYSWALNKVMTDIRSYEGRHSNDPIRTMLIGEIKASIPSAVLLGELRAIVPYWNLVKSGGRWDYKSRSTYLKIREKEALGNYAFGATAVAWADGATGGISNGLPEITINLARMGAGAYQEYRQPKNYRPSFGHWYDFFDFDSSYGDSPEDSANIYFGAQYYFSNQTRFQPSVIKGH